MRLRTLLLAAITPFTGAMASEDPKPLPPESQIAMLKVQREILMLQAKMEDLRRQYEAAAVSLKQQQTEMQVVCLTAAGIAKVDINRYTCDGEKLTFAPKDAIALPPAQK